jgi:hypothetical protein
MKKGSKHREESKNKNRLWHLGRKHFVSKETGIKISLAKKGHPVSLETKLKIKESVRKISKKGEKSNLWKGGKMKEYPEIIKIRKSLQYRLWREAVFKRDNFTCIWCGKKGNVQADHIKPFSLFPELRFAIDNGRTLCINCHKTTNTYGNHTKS